jgi:hypothetical protein
MPRQRRQREPKFWTCTRQKDGVKCNTLVPVAKKKCTVCDKPRPPKRTKKHMTALKAHDYDYFIEITGGEHCGICGVTRAQTKNPEKRLMRDHAHTTTGLGEPRGLLCFDCNWHLGNWYTPERVERMLAYLLAHERRMGRQPGEIVGFITDEEDAA